MLSKKTVTLSALTLVCLGVFPAFAAKPVDLSQQSINYIKSLTATGKKLIPAAGASSTALQEVSSSTDFNQTTHTRLKQTYAGYPVLGGDAVVHTPNAGKNNFKTLMASSAAAKSSMNGNVYEDLNSDLQNVPAYIFNAAQADKAFNAALTDFESKAGARADVRYKQSELMVFVDESNKAHWVFRVSASVKANGKLAKPTYLLDAVDLKVYQSWDDRKTAALPEVNGGGFGGNPHEGKLVYDGGVGHLANFLVQRDATKNLCYMRNELITVTDASFNKVPSYKCTKPDTTYNNVYWDADSDHKNGGYSPDNDAMFAAKIVSSMFEDWYQIPVLEKNGKPMHLEMVTHSADEGENAEWDDISKQMIFGDGGNDYYPFTSLGVTAHEVAHGFTSQHSNLDYSGQSGGMNEAFSDMADQAALYYATKSNDWQLGAELAKNGNTSFRYMDDPSKDCQAAGPGEQCSINSATDYRSGLNVHFSSGVYNRAFYLLSNYKGWNTRKAFDVMVQANRNYWTQRTTFNQGACGVLKATADYKYDKKAVLDVFKQVGVRTSKC